MGEFDMSELNPQPKERWQHYNGNIYEVMHIANITNQPNEIHPVTVVYKGVHNGFIWTRELSDWHRSMTLVK